MNKYHKLSDLSRETLIEIPAQFLSYVRAHSIQPRPKSQAQYNANQFAFNETDDQLRQQTLYSMPNAPVFVEKNDQFENAPLPPGWERAYDENGTVYYVDHTSGTTSWKHPSSLPISVQNNVNNSQQKVQQHFQ